ncbi:diaminopropionate ammonia-lyase [Rhodococcus sp. ABRD24]|uniref:diaminopropionate ammonia-lyase n=1 Tax=Rhodococcus sp. ABRD24 TaxID=2507582 RepID=UPI00103B4FD2|nr:diaminopropionate ammonia-lyase [Rhodococcus sp. ABRD24]QBJ96054.1 diaminopropionate ammonia-lyase [Rhodococcus sp. ABRD24]
MREPRVVSNPLVAPSQVGPLTADPTAFHRTLPGYEPTPLVESPQSARRLGVAAVHVKDESARLGMPSFKVLGASWATYRVLLRHLGSSPEEIPTLDALATRLAGSNLRLCAATDGNHGRAVARMAQLLGLRAIILVPADMVDERIAAIRSEGADVEVVDGGYDDAIARSAALASDDTLVVSDTSWDGYVDPPMWVIDGYSTMIAEIRDQYRDKGLSAPTVVAAQIGVGAFAAAVARGFAEHDGVHLVGVEPTQADCVTASIEAGGVLTIPGPQLSMMAGLNCGTPSIIAWPDVSSGYQTFVTISDEQAADAMRLLAADGVVSGESGAAGLGGLLAHADALGLGPSDSVLVISTEGATDVANYRTIVGAAPAAVTAPAKG